LFGAAASNVTVGNGAAFDVLAGGTASAIVVDGSLTAGEGIASVFSGDTTVGVTVTTDAAEDVFSGGKASATIVNSGGYLEPFAGGTIAFAAVSAGGRGSQLRCRGDLDGS
jgi:autotransporter passenger strand-loop-strand repeat protein